MDTRDGGVTSLWPASLVEIEYMTKEEWADGEGMVLTEGCGVMEEECVARTLTQEVLNSSLRLGVTYEKGVTLGNVTMSHRTRERPAECLASLSHSTMIVLDPRRAPPSSAVGSKQRRVEAPRRVIAIGRNRRAPLIKSLQLRAGSSRGGRRRRSPRCFASGGTI
ncbi:hypothetical protein EVAR_52930_1 [Eumeta japonica]|uniref:Uncharacterized protein n=1 Tax=Eumeta variegata TaxID=151549 RepID=A0A4C1Y641_EUMVA|nr:hypothetical protein EVAR_52930_1 [Eumeta japonica]